MSTACGSALVCRDMKAADASAKGKQLYSREVAGAAPSPLPAPAPPPELGSSSSRRSFASLACGTVCAQLSVCSAECQLN